ncbi:helix-turn-helix transcriptional regulator [Streptomyces sp. ISL-98]|uniref:helix-turn-helix domain-containing protein n=1 Tax=Streptomyces sp. ISL-98 TaxID=2819192 RepID=UPI001BE591B5|nr:helix-turn-helix transcriptional regulator [Streptomyces sp. ISL-98]MBT2506451.1 helix-turn-helix transcriptional regulator [Streptomyces sp. ISL-98]
MSFSQGKVGWPFFGSELKRQREAVPLTQQQLGERVYVSGTYVGQIESAIRKPQLDLAQRFDAELGTDGLLTRMCRELIDSSPHAPYFADAAALEVEAATISEYAPTLIPGVLQTEEYVRALMAPSAALLLDSALVETRIRARTDRAALLDDPTRPVLWAVLHETVLQVAVGGPALMGRQLSHLASLVRSERILVQVLPFSANAHAASGSMFALMTFEEAPPVAYSEGQYSGQLLDTPAMVAKYQLSYDLIRAAALSPEASLSLIESVAEDYKQ